MRWLLLTLLLVLNHGVAAQDFMSFLQPFLGSGLGGGGGGGGNPFGALGGQGGGGGGGSPFAGILSQFAGTGNNPGPGANSPFGDIFKLGAGFLNKSPAPAPAAPRPPQNRGPSQGFRPQGGFGPAPDASDYDIPMNQMMNQIKRSIKARPVQKPRPRPGARAQRQRPRPRGRPQNRRNQRPKWQPARKPAARKPAPPPRRNTPAAAPPPPPAATPPPTLAPEPLSPPASLGWMQKPGGATAGDLDADYDDNIDMSLTGARAAQAEQPQPVGRSQPQGPNPVFHRPNARTFVRNQATGPPIRPWTASRIQPAKNTFLGLFDQPSPAPIIPDGPTLAPPKLPKSDPKLLAHNTARMIREITSFSDHHSSGANQDYGAVEKLMEAFFEAVADPQKTNAQPLRDFAANPLQAQYDGTEMGANRPLTNKLFESDMVLTVEQMKGVVLAAQERGNRRHKRKVITGSVYRWAKAPIPYKFKGGDDTWKGLIRSALKHWEGETCVRWAENGAGKDHVIFFRGSGCYSSVGRTGGSQMISIGYGCEDKGIVTHEVGHSLGFWHEQSRPDRDKYIHLNKQYIIKGTIGNFELRTTQEIEDMGLPYDLGSVMHYGPNAFTNDWDQITIVTKDEKYQRTIGQRAKPSFIDVKQVNRLYCNDVCPKTGLDCKNGGYPDPNNCGQCKCPTGLGGTTCDMAAPSEAQCGGDLMATPFWQEMGHRGKKRCYWRIKTNNARIKIILSNQVYRCETTCKAFVEIKANSDFQQTGFRSCCDKELTVTSDQAEVLIFTDPTLLTYETGFNLRYIQDSGQPLPIPPKAVWVPGQENRGFRGATGGGGSGGGPIEKFILNAIPKIRDANRPLESLTSIVAEYGLASLLGIRTNKK